MITIKLPDGDNYHSLNDLTGYPPGVSLIVRNASNNQMRITQTTDKPAPSSLEGFPVWPTDTVLVHGNDAITTWCRGTQNGYIVVQELTSTITPFTGIEFPQDIVTSGVEGFRRLQVDQGQTGFFEAREFRAIRKIRLATGESQVYKFISTVEAIVRELRFAVTDGNYEVHIWDGSNVTETVVSSTPVTIFNKNDSQNEYRDYNGARYQSQVSVFTGGAITVTDPTLYRDYVELKTANATANESTIDSSAGQQRYIPATTYFVEIYAISGPVRGLLSMMWEERPIGVK